MKNNNPLDRVNNYLDLKFNSKLTPKKKTNKGSSDYDASKLDNDAKDWYSYFSKYLEAGRNLLYFIYKDQWEREIRSDRERRKKPTLTLNKLVPILNGILGEFRDNTPALTVRGVDEEAKQQDVELRNDLLRQIHYASNGDVLYQNVLKSCLEIGWGAFGVNIQYEDQNSFYQCIKLYGFHDYNSVFFDPTSQKMDKSDGDYCGYYEIVSKEDFKKNNPDIDNPQSAGDYFFYRNEYTRDILSICHQYCKHYFKRTIAKLSDGQILEIDEAKKYIELQNLLLSEEAPLDIFNDQSREPLSIIETREILDYHIIYYKYIKDNILQCKKWPGKLLPIIYVEGNSITIEGETMPLPYFADVMDSQRMANYFFSETAYSVLMSRREQWIGTKKNVPSEELQNIWIFPQNAQGLLLAEPDPITGALPQKITGDSFDQSFLQALTVCDQQISQCLGRYEENRGNESNAVSGIAISNRQQSGNFPVEMVMDNVKRGIEQGGRIQLELIPFVYNDSRNISVLDSKNNSRVVGINQPGTLSYSQAGNIEQSISNDMSKGKYDIEVRVDGNYDQQELEIFNTLTNLAKLNPQSTPVIQYYLAKYSGLPFSQELEEIFKMALPPDVKAIMSGQPPPPPQPPPPDPKMMMENQKLQIQQQQLQLQQQKLEVEKFESEVKSQLQKMEMMFRHYTEQQQIGIEKYKADADIVKEHISANKTIAQEHIKQSNKREHNDRK